MNIKRVFQNSESNYDISYHRFLIAASPVSSRLAVESVGLEGLVSDTDPGLAGQETGVVRMQTPEMVGHFWKIWRNILSALGLLPVLFLLGLSVRGHGRVAVGLHPLPEG